MPRVRRGYKARQRRNKVLKMAKGYVGGRRKLYRTAVDSVQRSLAFAYRDRKVKKREFRKLWIVRINAAVREHGLSYSRFIDGFEQGQGGSGPQGSLRSGPSATPPVSPRWWSWPSKPLRRGPAMRQKLLELKDQALAQLAAAPDEAALTELRTRYLGRKGLLTGLLRKTGALPPEERPAFGPVGQPGEAGVGGGPGRGFGRPGAPKPRQGRQAGGGRDTAGHQAPAGTPAPHHPKPSASSWRSSAAWVFSVVETPEVETDWYCFEALNMPPDHPARDMQDTFYLSDGVVLRTHTSSSQIRTMEKEPPPIRIVCPGKAFRRDSDATHTPMFHQVEGLMVGRGHLLRRPQGRTHQLRAPGLRTRGAGALSPQLLPLHRAQRRGGHRLRGVRGRGLPGVQHHTGWLEILGSGMVDPNVYKNVGYDPDKVTGFAFGMGIERIAMLRLGHLTTSACSTTTTCASSASFRRSRCWYR